MLVSIQVQADVLRQQLVLLLSEHGVDLPGGGPGCGAVFLAVPCPVPLGGKETDPRDVSSGAEQDGHQTVLGPVNAEGMIHSCRQVADDVRQAVTDRLGDQQRRPDHEDV